MTIQEFSRDSIDLQALLDSLPGMAFLKDRKLRYVMVNRNYLKFKKFDSGAEVIGKTDYDLYPPHKAEKIVAEDLQVLETQSEFRAEHYNNASGRTFSMVKVPLLGGDGEMLGVLGLSFDISELRSLADALSSSEKKYKFMTEHIRETIWIRDMNLSYLYLSPSVQNMKGWTVEEAMNLSLEQVVSPDSIETIMKLFSEELARDEDPGVDPSRTLSLVIEEICKDGSTIWTESSLSFMRDEKGRPTGILGLTRDITERRKLENKLMQSQKLEAVGRLAGGVAHDFNNTLSVILSYAGFVKEALPLDSPIQADLDEIVTAGRRAADLTRQLLSFSRREMVTPQVVQLSKVFTSMEKLLKRTISEDIKLVSEFAPGLRKIKIDPGSLEQVIFNLAVNARDAMPEGGVLKVSAENFDLLQDDPRRHTGLAAGTYVKRTITHTGTGLSEKVMEHLFEPFFSTKEHGKGFGLGLSAIYGIVKQASGEIFVTTEQGKGTSFAIFFPSTEEFDTADFDMPSVLPAGQRQIVLVVEDEEAVRALVGRMLTQSGFEVISTSNAMDAMLLARRMDRKIHLLLTDIVMPEMSGRDLALQLGAIKPDMKIAYMTGYPDDVVAAHGITEKTGVIIKKPFSKDGLLLKIREALLRRE
ncbi:MAG: PAS domain-containing protein [Myxococcota bacterium]|jgi:PAS domain S-box-containing protein